MTRYPKDTKSSKWTKLELDSITSEWNGDTLADGGGLRGDVRLSKNGVISIKFKYGFRLKGKSSLYYQCGTYPTNSLAVIRENRDKARELVALGIDPRAKKKADKLNAQATIDAEIANAEEQKKQNLSFQELFSYWIENGVSRTDNNKSLIQSFTKHMLPKLGDVPIKDLNDRMLRDVYKSIANKGTQRTAISLFNDTKQMFRWAEKRKPWRSLMVEGNPALLVEEKEFVSDYVSERTRTLGIEELRSLKKIFEQTTNEYQEAQNKYTIERPLKAESQIALWLCLSTACRIGELLMTEWKHVDFDSRVWFIPAENTKKVNSKKQTDHHVYLSDFALNQFKKLAYITGSGKWAFPSSNKPDLHVDIKSVTKQVGDRQMKFKHRSKSLSKRINSNSLVIGDREWTPHDLRRTASTMMQELKINPDVIDRCQHHQIAGSKIRRHYMHYEYRIEMQDAWEKLGHHLEKILS